MYYWRSAFHFRCLILLLSCAFILSTAAIGQQRPQQTQQRKKPNIAVMDFDARGGLTKEEAASLSDIFQAQLVDMGEFIVVDRQRIKAILSEQGFQQSEACSQVECIVEAGKILKVEKMFAGTIGKVGRIYNVNISAIDIATAQIVINKSRQHSGDIEELASEIVPEIANEIAQEMLGRKVASTVKSTGGSTWYYYVGGALLVGGGAAAFLLKPAAGADGGGETKKPLPGAPTFPN
ncbi:MAG TPA: CsgG/HfaB family protein [Bacteroidota bacterium]|nr:CsgG/HfaB family protein [Bacteroidota bacterium]